MDSLEYIFVLPRSNLLNSVFDKQLNTYNLFSNVDYIHSTENFKLRLNESFNTSFIRASENSVREEHHLNLNTSYRLNERLSVGLLGYNSILSDDRKLEINQASVSFATLYNEIKLADRITLSPFAGYSNNRQIGENDYGFLYGIEGEADYLRLTDFTLFSELRFRNEDILPRRNLIRYYNIIVSNNFDRNVFNSVNAVYSQSRKDFYFDADSLTASQFRIENNIQSRIETNYLFQDRLEYNRFLEIFSLNLLGRINYRNIDRDTRFKSSLINSTSVFDTEIDELKIEFESVVRYESDFFDGMLRFNFNERDEKHKTKNFEGSNQVFFEQREELDTRKNNNSNRLALSFLGAFNFSRSDRLILSLFQSKLKYDTPSSLNDDDRDEVLSILRLRYSKFLSPYFETFVNLEGTFSHIVYVFSGRSSNNNINRILRFKTGGSYRGKNISSYNSFEVSANYTFYDFEDVSSSFQSFSFRQLTAVDSSTIKLSKRISLNVYSYVKLSEQGDFAWNDFSERPTRFLEEIYVEPRVVLHLGSSYISSGVRFFQLKTYNYDVRDKILDSEYKSIGPIVDINLYLFRLLRLNISGWYEFISVMNSDDKEQTRLLMQMNWNF